MSLENKFECPEEFENCPALRIFNSSDWIEFTQRKDYYLIRNKRESVKVYCSDPIQCWENYQIFRYEIQQKSQKELDKLKIKDILKIRKDTDYLIKNNKLKLN